MQTNNNETKTIHIKAVLNNEFRRFTMDNPDFSRLEETIRTVYSLDPTEKLKICFVDDEKDSVTMSSDEEFRYAADLVRPVRLIIALAIAPTPVPELVTSNEVEMPNSVEQPFPAYNFRGGRGRGRGRWQCRGDKDGWTEEKEKYQHRTKEEIVQRKTAKISGRIKHVEAMLLTDLPAQRERTLKWKLDLLRSKHETLQLAATTGTTSETPSPATCTETSPCTSEPPETFQHGCRGGRGRGGRGCGRGRRAIEGTDSSKWDLIWENIKTCRQNLRAARQSGNQNDIDRCEKALEEAKIQKWEAKQKAKAADNEGSDKPKFFEEKSTKRECMQNLRAAKASGDADKIKSCEKALIEAKEALQKAKVASKC